MCVADTLMTQHTETQAIIIMTSKLRHISVLAAEVAGVTGSTPRALQENGLSEVVLSESLPDSHWVNLVHRILVDHLDINNQKKDEPCCCNTCANSLIERPDGPNH